MGGLLAAVGFWRPRRQHAWVARILLLAAVHAVTAMPAAISLSRSDVTVAQTTTICREGFSCSPLLVAEPGGAWIE
jgi:hypothetical protein